MIQGDTYPTARTLSPGSRTSTGKDALLIQDVSKEKKKHYKQDVFTHGPHRLHHFSCDIPVRKGGADEDEEGLPPISSSFSLTEEMWRQREHKSLATLNDDLAALVRGSVKCKKGKPPSTKETREEAFDNYMKIIYRLPLNIKVDLEDMFELPFYPDPCDKSCNVPVLEEDVHLESRLNIPAIVEGKKEQKRSKKQQPKTLMRIEPWPVDMQKTPVVVDEEEALPKGLSPLQQPKPKSPSPLTPPTLLPQWEPAPEVPSFLRQFAGESWITDLYPDKKCINSSLSPEDFSLQLLEYFNSCGTPLKMKILAVLQELQSQGLLCSADKLYQGLIDLLPKFVRPSMSPTERVVLVEMLNLLMCLRSAGYDHVKNLLVLLAFKNVGLRETALNMLTALGVNEAEQWLCPELESWNSELDPSNIWKGLNDRADCWLDSWIAKYKEHNRYQYIRNTAKKKPPTFSMADVLNYFCSTQKYEYRRARCVASPGRKDTVLLPSYDCSSHPILRLGETYSMARMFRPPGLFLPPLRNRPFLRHFPKFMSLPLSRVTLRPFYSYSDKDWVKVSPRQYFILQQSYVEYYR